MARILPLLAIALMGGCLGAPEVDEGTWHLGGSFTVERTDADIRAVCEAVREHNPDCALMESWPEQFGFRFPSLGACETARAKIASVPHTTVRACDQIA